MEIHWLRISPFQDDAGSTLTMTDVSVSDSGNYSCQPRDMRPAAVAVTILSERQAPDALQDKTTHTASSASSLTDFNMLIVTSVISSYALLRHLRDAWGNMSKQTKTVMKWSQCKNQLWKMLPRRKLYCTLTTVKIGQGPNGMPRKAWKVQRSSVWGKEARNVCDSQIEAIMICKEARLQRRSDCCRVELQLLNWSACSDRMKKHNHDSGTVLLHFISKPLWIVIYLSKSKNIDYFCIFT